MHIIDLGVWKWGLPYSDGRLQCPKKDFSLASSQEHSVWENDITSCPQMLGNDPE